VAEASTGASHGGASGSRACAPLRTPIVPENLKTFRAQDKTSVSTNEPGLARSDIYVYFLTLAVGLFSTAFKYNPLKMNSIRRSLLVLISLVLIAAPALAGIGDPNLKLDPTYGLFPRPAGHTYFPSPEDWRDVNMYQIFTDRFADGDSANNTTSAMGINRSSWFVDNSGRSFPHNRNFHHGGDWKGLKDNLDYLTGMGVNAVWISGVQMNAQGRDLRYTPYHQYHPTDFFNVDPAQGTFQELKDLIDACHARGIYVILDVVINHTADLNGLFGNNTNDDKQYWPNGNGTHGWWDSRRHAYPFNELFHFHNNGTINNWDAFPETLRGQFRGTDDLATDTPHVTYWITEAFRNLIDATDCDGFRVDAIKHVEYNWVKKWADDIRKHAETKGKNDFLLFGELFVYDNNALASYCKEPGFSFNSALFFPMSQTIKSVFIDGGGTGQLTGQLNNVPGYGEGANRLVTFIDNHDVNRISIQNGGDTGNDIWKLRPALSFLYLATPVPCLYYGTEHAFNQGNHFNGQDAWQQYEGQPYDDADWQRECMFDRGFQPGPAQGNKLAATNAPLYQHIKVLNEARAKHRSLTRGSFQQRWDSNGWGPYAFSRVFNNEESLVALNTADGNVSLQPAVGKPNGTVFVNTLNPSDTLTVTGGTLNVSLAGKETKIYVVGVSQPSEVSVSRDGNNFTFTYRPNEGPLKGAASITLQIRADNGSFVPVVMTNNAGVFTATYTMPGGTDALTYYFQSGSTIDNNNGGNFTLSTAPGFVMDGEFDSQNFIVSDNGMRIYAAIRGNKLYTATWSTKDGVNDHFIFITDEFGNPVNHPWAKAGRIFMNTASKPWIGANPTDAYANNFGSSGRFFLGDGGKALETEIDLLQVFGKVPKILYFAVGAYPRANGGNLLSQAPASFGNWADDIEVAEFQAVNTASIRDENIDGHFDTGRPEMRTQVNGNDRDGNYDLRRFYLDELANESAQITVRFKPNAAPGASVTDVEVFTNLNRRDHAVLEEDPATVTTNSDTYFRAYPMSGPDGQGFYSATLPVNLCGAYRLQVRYKINGVNGGDYIYYTDSAQRRDLAVVVSPKKALTVNMYEVNPLIVEAKDTSFAGRSTFLDLVNDPDLPGESGGYDGRPDALNKLHYSALGVNMLWLQPIHPIGVDGRDLNPETPGLPFDPGSPYAVRDYWSVAPMLGRGAGNSASTAMAEFQTFVSRLDEWGVGVMMDGTFNHSAPDAIMGQGAADLGLPYAPSAQIRNANPGWFAKQGFPAQPAANAAEIAIAPDRNDFGDWTDVRELYFGNYDTLVKAKGTQNADKTYPDNAHKFEFLLERDEFFGHTETTRQVWEYFAYYPIYWLEQSGHPRGTPKNESYKGIDGLRCDFAQGLPSQFWEYCINKTRSVKWDFIFMAESLDGFRDVAGSKRHGVGYRSARHFDILNENIVFYWRDSFFGYPANGGPGNARNPKTVETWQAYDDRRNAFDNVTLLNNLVSHDEVFPHNDVFSIAYAYAQVGALDGIPMLMYGQEAGAQNSAAAYSASVGLFGPIDAANNFAKYESNFGKNIPNFKVYNQMSQIWTGRTGSDWALQNFYGRINRARLTAPALQSQNVYFLSKTTGGYDDNMFAVGKVKDLGANAGAPGQSVVFAFVNNNYRGNPSVASLFSLNAPLGAGNYFGIQRTRSYNVRDLLSDTPNAFVWGTDRTGADLIDNGLYVGLPYQPAPNAGGYHAHYLQLVDMTAPTITFTPAATASFGSVVTLSASNTANASVTYSVVGGDTDKVTLNGNQLTIGAGAGSVVVRATVAETADRAGAQSDATINFTKAAQTVTFTLDPSTGTVGTSRALGGTASSGLTVSYTTSNPAVATVSGSTLTLVGAGTATITAVQNGNENFAAANSVAREITVTGAGVSFDSVFGGQAPDSDLNGDGVVALLEYGLGGHPASNNSGILPQMERNDGKLTLTALIRTNDPVLTNRAVWSTNLAAPDAWQTSNITWTVHTNQEDVTEGFQRRVFSVDESGNSEMFLRLIFELQNN
jgi:glycosidase